MNSSTYFSQSSSTEDPSLPPWVDKSTLDVSGGKCIKQNPVIEDGVCVGFSNASAEESCSKEDLIYSTSVMETSLVQEYGFACDEYYLRTIYSAIYMLGMLVGSYFFGWISDTYGRMKSLMLAVLVVSLSGFLG